MPIAGTRKRGEEDRLKEKFEGDAVTAQWLQTALTTIASLAVSGKARARLAHAALRESRLPAGYQDDKPMNACESESETNTSSPAEEQAEQELDNRLSCVEPVLRAKVRMAHGLEVKDVDHVDKLRRNVAEHAMFGVMDIAGLTPRELRLAQKGKLQGDMPSQMLQGLAEIKHEVLCLRDRVGKLEISCAAEGKPSNAELEIDKLEVWWADSSDRRGDADAAAGGAEKCRGGEDGGDEEQAGRDGYGFGVGKSLRAVTAESSKTQKCGDQVPVSKVQPVQERMETGSPYPQIQTIEKNREEANMQTKSACTPVPKAQVVEEGMEKDSPIPHILTVEKFREEPHAQTKSAFATVPEIQPVAAGMQTENPVPQIFTVEKESVSNGKGSGSAEKSNISGDDCRHKDRGSAEAEIRAFVRKKVLEGFTIEEAISEHQLCSDTG